QLGSGEQEAWPNVTLDPNEALYLQKLLNDPQNGSRLVTVCDRPPDGRPTGHTRLQLSAERVVVGRLEGGADGLRTLTTAHFAGRGDLPDSDDTCGEMVKRDQAWGLITLELIDDISMVALPDLMVPKPVAIQPPKPLPLSCDALSEEPTPPPLPESELEFAPGFKPEEIRFLQNHLIQNHCEPLKDRFAILDTWDTDRTPTEAEARRRDFDTSYGALYYPWLLVPDPLQLEGLLRPIPPSGHVAGVYARVTNQVGVHKPPANEVVEGVQDVVGAVDDDDHGRLNMQGVNVIRSYNGRGLRLGGARTLSSDSEWRYINVRRLLLMIAESIDQQLQWTVFEAGNSDLWRDIDRVVRSFLDNLWRRGMLDGETAADAYRVTCDETTNPPSQTDQGRIICEIGVQPPWPAEFVVVRIGKTENSTEIL
ncbi:MAG: phage tail sheath subtilisin-like domain-containing protein, partial [Chloroflexota bacterium]